MQESMRAGPYGYGRHEIVSALAGLGYTRYGDPAPGAGRISPEELVACLIYSRDHRWISAVAVVLCRASIDWDRMVRLAVDYGFPGTLRGMIEAVRSTGRDIGSPALDRLAAYEPVQPDDIRAVLDTYGC
ncbi:MAG: hypothetical protein IS632_08350 [Thaumarchaeota archaeon]|nr:hypothetical protein [Nitrososphaerota archaeon]